MFKKLHVKTASSVVVISTWILLGTVIYHNLEDWTWDECFYFSVVTLTTVGYGDLHPTTDTSRMFTVAFLLTGVAVVLAALGVIGEGILSRREQQVAQRRELHKEEDS